MIERTCSGFSRISAALRCAASTIEPRPPHRLAAPLHLRRMHAHMLGRLDFETALLMRAMIDADVETRPGEMRVGDLLPRLADLPKLELRAGQVVCRKPLVLALDERFLG